MPLNRLSRITIGVPDVAVTGRFYEEFGLIEVAPGRYATTDGGEQLHLVTAPVRRLLEIELGCDEADDLARIERQLISLDFDCGVEVRTDEQGMVVVEPVTGTSVRIEVAAPLIHTQREQAPYNAPGAYERIDARAPGTLREGPVRPRKLSHVVIGTPDLEMTRRFFVDALGFKVSDEIEGLGAFLRCSSEHHNVFIQAAPVPYLHHSSWQVDDVDEIGRGATAMLATDPGRHVWGLGRHFIGSNFFWYLRDPAGNFAEYSSDIDVIVDDELWEPGVWSGMRSLMAWGPPVPPSFIAPDDLAELMVR
jgi:catechol 2,3-dioxygenase-like lactoylglutathione lyase family enzyme